MQPPPHHKYDLRYSKKRSREPEKQEGTIPQVIPPVPDRGKGKPNPNPSKIKIFENKGSNSFEGHIEKDVPILLKTTSGEEEGAKPRGIEKFQPVFNLQKELERVKILVPLIELIK